MRFVGWLILFLGSIVFLSLYWISLHGWQISAWSRPRDLTCRRHDCYDHGTCLIGKCFCLPGYDGIDCEKPWQQGKIKPCQGKNDDTCFIHPLYGVGEVPFARWKSAVGQESSVWHKQHHDRWDDHLAGFDNYKVLPDQLGDMIEFGCGPFTQTLSIFRLKNRQFNVSTLTLWDPNAAIYMKRVRHCSYKNGTLRGFEHIPTTIVTAPSEEMCSHVNKFDTIVMINVIEHVQNAYKILQNIYNSLRPNGILVLGERWWDHMFIREKYASQNLHPIHIKFYVWKWFTDHFETMHDVRNHRSYLKYGHNGSYFIGRKSNKTFL